MCDFGEILGSIPIIGDFLAPDKSAETAAAEQRRQQEQLAQQAQETQARQQATLMAQMTGDAAKRDAELATLTAEQKKKEEELSRQRDALRLTGGALAPMGVGGGMTTGLPGFDKLKKPKGSQTNVIGAPSATLSQLSGFNTGATGRRYV